MPSLSLRSILLKEIWSKTLISTRSSAVASVQGDPQQLALLLFSLTSDRFSFNVALFFNPQPQLCSGSSAVSRISHCASSPLRPTILSAIPVGSSPLLSVCSSFCLQSFDSPELSFRGRFVSNSFDSPSVLAPKKSPQLAFP